MGRVGWECQGWKLRFQLEEEEPGVPWCHLQVGTICEDSGLSHREQVKERKSGFLFCSFWGVGGG